MKSGGEAEFAEDLVVKETMTERWDYKLFHKPLWEFLVSKYGGQPIKRYYIRESPYWSKVEVKYAMIEMLMMPVSAATKD